MANSTQQRIDFLHKISLFIIDANYKQIKLLCYFFHRTTIQQVKLYAQGRVKPGKIVTYCDGVKKKSYHQKWRAMDFVIVKDGQLIWHYIKEYDILGKIWKGIGGKWGGDFKFKDYFHFQL